MFLNNASSSLKADCVHDVFTQYFVKIFTFFFFAEGGFLPVVLHWSQPANPNTDRTTSYIGRASIHLFKTGRENEIESLAWIADTKCCVTSSLVHPNETVIITSLSCLKSHDKSTVAARYPTLKKRICTGQLEVQSGVLLISDGSNVTTCIRFCSGCEVVIAKYRNTVHLDTRAYLLSVFPLLTASPPLVCVYTCCCSLSHHEMCHGFVTFS